MVNESPHDRFCERCGRSLLPLNSPHVARKCEDCDKTVHVVEVGDGGKGIRIRKGDRFTIPKGFIKLSLDPAVGGKLFRPGIGFLLRQFIYAGNPRSSNEVVDLLERYEEVADEILKGSELLADLDLEKEEDARRAFEILEEKKDTREWHALLLGTFGTITKKAIESGNIEEAVWAMYQSATVHAMTVVREPVFEQTLWRGYLASLVVYEAASAASTTPGEAEAIQELRPLFERLDEATLHAWVESGLPIGPRIGVDSLPEPLLSALAKFHLAELQRKRQEAKEATGEDRFLRELRVKWAGVGVGATSALVVVLKAIGIL